MQPPGTERSDSSAEPSVHVIVITCNGRRHLEGCFSSLTKTDYPNYRTWLVDNASSDGSAEYVAAHFPDVMVLRNKENLGFARGNNLAMLRALEEGADFIFLLNDDTILLDERWLRAAVEEAQRDLAVDMIGFQLLDTPVLAPGGRPTLIESEAATRIDGCALFMRASLLKAIGLLDEVYFAYAEEDDLEARAIRAGAQLRRLNVPIYHFGGGTSKRIPRRAAYLQMRNAIRYSIKQRSLWRAMLRIGKILDVACNPFSFFLDRQDSSHLRMRGSANVAVNFFLLLAAVRWNLWFLPETLRIRRQERKLVAAYVRSSKSALPAGKKL